jgi:hypothetical protein
LQKTDTKGKARGDIKLGVWEGLYPAAVHHGGTQGAAWKCRYEEGNSGINTNDGRTIPWKSRRQRHMSYVPFDFHSMHACGIVICVADLAALSWPGLLNLCRNYVYWLHNF